MVNNQDVPLPKGLALEISKSCYQLLDMPKEFSIALSQRVEGAKIALKFVESESFKLKTNLNHIYSLMGADCKIYSLITGKWRQAKITPSIIFDFLSKVGDTSKIEFND